ncbi:MAG: hypothetical protein KAJ10_10945 [Thermodesulfovibrionia bacterium]|nr:hypothetical protein [Thermodesulfovibrionia bacterium]
MTKEFLQTLFEKISDIGFSATNRYPGKEFVREWQALCLKHTTDTVLLAWNDIKQADPYKYYHLNIWHNSLKSHRYQPQDIKRSKTEWDSDTITWKENLKENFLNFLNRKITRQEYLNIAVETKQMTHYEAEQERQHYLKLGHDLNDYCKPSGLIT